MVPPSKFWPGQKGTVTRAGLGQDFRAAGRVEVLQGPKCLGLAREDRETETETKGSDRDRGGV